MINTFKRFLIYIYLVNLMLLLAIRSLQKHPFSFELRQNVVNIFAQPGWKTP